MPHIPFYHSFFPTTHSSQPGLGPPQKPNSSSSSTKRRLLLPTNSYGHQSPSPFLLLISHHSSCCLPTPHSSLLLPLNVSIFSFLLHRPSTCWSRRASCGSRSPAPSPHCSAATQNSWPKVLPFGQSDEYQDAAITPQPPSRYPVLLRRC